MTRLELANQLIKQLQEQNASNIDMIDKLQQQVQVQQTWFQFAVGIFITIAITTAGLTWLSIRAENKRSREEIVNLKKELGIDNLIDIVDEQLEKYEEMKRYTTEWDENMRYQTASDFVVMMVDIRSIKADSSNEVIKGLAKIMGVIERPGAEDIPSKVVDIFIEGLVKFWNDYQKEDEKEIRKSTIIMFNEIFKKVEDCYLSVMSEKMATEFKKAYKESGELMNELK